MKLSYTASYLYQSTGVAKGITDETVHDYKKHVNDAIDRVDQKITEKTYGFINILSDKQMIKQIQALFQSLRWAKTLVVVGIGGSDLGARAIQQALEEERAAMDVIFHGDSTDPMAITRLLRQIDLEDTIFCIISKSGETIETITQYVFFKSVMKQQSEDWAEHFIFITDAKKGILREEADKHHIPTLAIPDDVGGRFSVQTTVGLFPAMAMGVDIEKLLEGGKDIIKNHRDLAKQIATDQYYLYQQEIQVNILMPYSVQLEEFARWFRQLWAESLGKGGKGVLPIQARGPADQHSQVQFYTEGTLLHSLLFLRVEKRDEDFSFDEVDIAPVSYLKGHSFHEIINAEQHATALALKKAGRPNATLSVDHVDAFSLGQLFLLFELAVVYLAEMFEINAFDQPGVEEGKVMMYALLGRSGYEAKKKEIEELMK
jgi:glucose-6-phosphate isomerase